MTRTELLADMMVRLYWNELDTFIKMNSRLPTVQEAYDMMPLTPNAFVGALNRTPPGDKRSDCITVGYGVIRGQRGAIHPDADAKLMQLCHRYSLDADYYTSRVTTDTDPDTFMYSGRDDRVWNELT